MGKKVAYLIGIGKEINNSNFLASIRRLGDTPEARQLSKLTGYNLYRFKYARKFYLLTINADVITILTSNGQATKAFLQSAEKEKFREPFGQTQQGTTQQFKRIRKNPFYQGQEYEGEPIAVYLGPQRLHLVSEAIAQRWSKNPYPTAIVNHSKLSKRELFFSILFSDLVKNTSELPVAYILPDTKSCQEYKEQWHKLNPEAGGIVLFLTYYQMLILLKSTLNDEQVMQEKEFISWFNKNNASIVDVKRIKPQFSLIIFDDAFEEVAGEEEDEDNDYYLTTLLLTQLVVERKIVYGFNTRKLNRLHYLVNEEGFHCLDFVNQFPFLIPSVIEKQAKEEKEKEKTPSTFKTDSDSVVVKMTNSVKREHNPWLAEKPQRILTLINLNKRSKSLFPLIANAISNPSTTTIAAVLENPQIFQMLTCELMQYRHKITQEPYKINLLLALCVQASGKLNSTLHNHRSYENLKKVMVEILNKGLYSHLIPFIFSVNSQLMRMLTEILEENPHLLTQINWTFVYPALTIINLQNDNDDKKYIFVNFLRYYWGVKILEKIRQVNPQEFDDFILGKGLLFADNTLIVRLAQPGLGGRELLLALFKAMNSNLFKTIPVEYLMDAFPHLLAIDMLNMRSNLELCKFLIENHPLFALTITLEMLYPNNAVEHVFKGYGQAGNTILELLLAKNEALQKAIKSRLQTQPSVLSVSIFAPAQTPTEEQTSPTNKPKNG